jgi:drug/metabolite transporter (DMT)-like permease
VAPPSSVVRGYLFGLIGVVIFGLTLPATRLAVAEMDPVFIALGRGLVAALAAGCVLVAVRARVPDRADWSRILAFGLAVVIGFPVLMTIAMRTVPAAHAGIVLGVLPLLTAMASVLVGGERPSAGFWACGIAGTVLVAGYAVVAAGPGAAEGLHVGDGLLALAGMSAALGYALGGALSRRLAGWEVISWALVATAPLMLIGLIVIRPPINWSASAPAWGAFAYVALFSQFIGFFAWNKGLALGGIAKVGQVQLLQTFVTLAGAAALLGETIGALELTIALVIVALVALGSRMRVERASPANT